MRTGEEVGTHVREGGRKDMRGVRIDVGGSWDRHERRLGQVCEVCFSIKVLFKLVR